MDKTIKTAVIYARVSSVIDRQNTDRQVRDLQAYATANGYDVSHVYTEHISGAKKNEERPVLMECLSFCFGNGVHTLLVSELSRLGRSTFEVLANVRECNARGVNIYLQKEGFSTLTPEGKENPLSAIMISVLGTCAQMERENIHYRLESGRQKYIAEGGKLGRKVGYRKPTEDKEKQYAPVIKMLREASAIAEKGAKLPQLYTIRGISEYCHVGVSTVQRVKSLFNL